MAFLRRATGRDSERAERDLADRDRLRSDPGWRSVSPLRPPSPPVSLGSPQLVPPSTKSPLQSAAAAATATARPPGGKFFNFAECTVADRGIEGTAPTPMRVTVSTGSLVSPPLSSPSLIASLSSPHQQQQAEMPLPSPGARAVLCIKARPAAVAVAAAAAARGKSRSPMVGGGGRTGNGGGGSRGGDQQQVPTFTPRAGCGDARRSSDEDRMQELTDICDKLCQFHVQRLLARSPQPPQPQTPQQQPQQLLPQKVLHGRGHVSGFGSAFGSGALLLPPPESADAEASAARGSEGVEGVAEPVLTMGAFTPLVAANGNSSGGLRVAVSGASSVPAPAPALAPMSGPAAAAAALPESLGSQLSGDAYELLAVQLGLSAVMVEGAAEETWQRA
ncbi:unnamed protein product, partial [Phaeothamnion confervicola]